MNRTGIEWVRNPDGSPGWTFNPVTGCLNSCRDTYCYASKLANGRLKARYLANSKIAPLRGLVRFNNEPATQLADPFYPRFWPSKLEDVSPLDKPRGIFVCNMGELFGPWLPRTWTEQVMETISEAPQHRFYLLTKQPQELVKWSPFPPNCWVGVSIENNYTYLGDLQRVEASVKYLSIEPLLDWREFPAQKLDHILRWLGISWLIIGAQTKPTVIPKIEWVKEIVEAADRAGVKVFLKDSLKKMRGPLKIALSDDQFQEMYGERFRQEMPEGVPCVV